ncbi:MAG: hypothetical protein RAP03_20650, partial [Candidatus Electryonea clarkiae]|nr:hypothetical protein [Candidatus Electryonea clarkiae]
MPSDLEIKILSAFPDRWIVESHLPSKEFRGDLLISNIRKIKKAVSSEVKVPLSLLSYSDIVSKKRTEDGLVVAFTFVRIKVEQGPPEVRIEPVITT